MISTKTEIQPSFLIKKIKRESATTTTTDSSSSIISHQYQPIKNFKHNNKKKRKKTCETHHKYQFQSYDTEERTIANHYFFF